MMPASTGVGLAKVDHLMGTTIADSLGATTDEFLTTLPPATTAIIVWLLIGWRFRPRPPARRVATTQPQPTSQSDGGRANSASGPGREKFPTSVRRGVGIRRRRSVGPDDAARWCDSIARSVRAGSSLSLAIEEADRPRPIDRALRSGLAEQLAQPDEVSVATVRVSQRLPELVSARAISPDLRLVLGVLTTVARLGGPAAEPIDRAGVILRARASAKAERASQSAQARMSALVMTLLPIAMLVLLVMTSASVRQAISTTVGVGVVGLGVALNLCGWWWMHRIISGGAR